MNIEYLCNHIIKIIQCPVRIFDLDNKLQKTFGIYDNKEPLEKELQNRLLENPEINFPILNIDNDNIVYARVICNDKKIIVGPCNISKILYNMPPPPAKFHSIYSAKKLY